MNSRTYKKSRRLCRRHRGGTTTSNVNFAYNPTKYASAGILKSGCAGTQSGMAAAAAKYVPYSPSAAGVSNNAAQLGGMAGPSAPLGEGGRLPESYGSSSLRTALHNRPMHKHTSLNVASAKNITGGRRRARSRRHRHKHRRSSSHRHKRRHMGGTGQPYSNIPYTPGYSLGGLSLSPNESALANGYMKPYNNCGTVKRN